MEFTFQREIKSLIAVFLFMLSLSLLVGSVSPVYATGSANSHVCPAGNVKYEVDSGYEYNDGSGGVSVTGTTVNWGPTAGYEVTGICIKAGQDLYHPTPTAGTYSTANGKDISHVVLYTKRSEEPQNGDQPETPNGPGEDAGEEKDKVLGAVLPETGIDVSGLVLATLAFQVGLFLRRRGLVS